MRAHEAMENEDQPLIEGRLVGPPDPQDLANLRDKPDDKHFLSRVFNKAIVKLDDEMKRITQAFYTSYFDPKITRPNFSNYADDKQAHVDESPFDNKGNFKPWLKKYMPKSKQQAFNQFVNYLLKRASLEIYNEQGEFRPWVREALGTKKITVNGEEKDADLLDVLIEMYGRETLHTELAQSVACAFCVDVRMIEPEIDQTVEEAATADLDNRLEEKDLLFLILNSQISAYIKMRVQLNHLKNNLAANSTNIAYAPLNKICEALAKQGQERIYVLENNMCQDPGKIVNLMDLANAMYSLPSTSPLFLNCYALLNGKHSKKNMAQIKQVLEALDILKKYENYLNNFSDKNSEIYLNREKYIDNQRQILSDLMVNNNYKGINQFVESLTESNVSMLRLDTLYKALENPSDAKDNDQYQKMGRAVYNEGVSLVANSLQNGKKIPAILAETLLTAQNIINNKDTAKELKEKLKKRFDDLPAPEKKHDMDPGYAKYLAALINLGNIGPDFKQKTFDEWSEEKRQSEKTQLLSLFTQLDDIRFRCLRELPPCLESSAIDIAIEGLLSKSADSINGKDDAERGLLLYSNDSLIQALNALLHYNNALSEVKDETSALHMSKGNLLAQKETELLSLLREGKDLSDFTRMLEQDSLLIDNFNALHKEMWSLKQSEKKESSPETKENLKVMKEAGLDLLAENQKMALEILQRKHDEADLRWPNECVKAMTDAIKNRGKEKESQEPLLKLDDLSKNPPGNPNRKRKIIGAIAAFVFAGVCLAGIPFTFGLSAAIGVGVAAGMVGGGALLAAISSRYAYTHSDRKMAKPLQKKIAALTSSASGLFVKPKTTRQPAEPQSTTLSVESKKLMGEIIQSLQETGSLSKEQADLLYKTANRDKTLRNFISQYIVPHLSDATLYYLTDAMMQAQLRDVNNTVMMLRMTNLGSDLYAAFFKRVNPSSDAYQIRITPELNALNNLIIENMRQNGQPHPEQSAGKAIFFRMFNFIPGASDSRMTSLVESFATAPQPTVPVEKATIPSINLDASVNNTKEFDALKLVSEKLLLLSDAIDPIPDEGMKIAALILLEKAISKNNEFEAKFSSETDEANLKEMRSEAIKKQSFMTKIIAAIEGSKEDNPGYRINFLSLIAMDQKFKSYLDKNEFGNSLAQFVIQAAIAELNNPENPNKDHDPETLTEFRKESLMLAEKFKDNPEKLADLCSLVTSVIKTDYLKNSTEKFNAAISLTNEKVQNNQEKYKGNNEFDKLHSVLQKFLAAPAVQNVQAMR